MAPKPKHPDLFILAGQSNMEGCGFLKESLPPVKGAWMLDMRHRLRQAADPLHDLLGSLAPVDRGLRWNGTPQDVRAKGEAAYRAYWRKRNGDVGAGLGLAFARLYRKKTGREVLLIPCAHGGTSLEQWNPSKKGEGLGSLYGAMLERTRMARDLVPGAKVRGLLFYQGESDADGEAARSYGDRFEAWVASARKDLGAPGLPIYTVQIGAVASAVRPDAGWNLIRRHQLVAEKRIRGVYTTSAVDLALIDGIHIDAAGLIRLGERLARLALAADTRKGPKGMGPRPSKMTLRRGKRDMAEIVISITGNQGSLGPQAHTPGFSVTDAEGNPHPQCRVADAHLDPTGKVITLRLSSPVKKGDRIGYNLGLQPAGRVVDGRDQPLPAFELEVP